MKKLLPLLSLLVVGSAVFAQCVLIPHSIQKRVYDSDIVIEGRVLKSTSYWNDDNDFIYTVHLVQVGKVFQEDQRIPNVISVVTQGGIVGTSALKVDPSLELRGGDVGVFFLKKKSFDLEKCSACDEILYRGVASAQSFVKYDEVTMKAHGYYEVFSSIDALLYPKIKGYTKQEVREVSDLKIGPQGIQKLAAPVISSFSMDTVSGGTQTVLTINGSNFGIIRDKGRVEFIHPDFGDGRYFEPDYSTTYKSWSNSKIEIYVPMRAGTGKVRVTNNSNESGTSSGDLHVKYAHSNIGYNGSTGIDSAYFMIAHIDDNSNGGYTWQLNRKFALHQNAVNSFLRAAENWRCETKINWDLGDDSNVDDIARDNVNLVRYTKFPDNKLGVCYSWYNGCFNGGNIHWYVAELDIEFDSTRSWYFGTGKPGNSQFDFETVATHELGHGHQLGHVIDNTKIMHYSLGPGDRNVQLSSSDLEGGQFVHNRSVTGLPCGPGDFEAIDVDDCNITKPKAGFAITDTVICPSEFVQISDATEGKVNTYAWNFGEDASMPNAGTKGPHSVSYSTPGVKVIRLIASNTFGMDTIERTILVEPAAPESPSSFDFASVQCVGISDFEINAVENATSYKWEVSNNGNISTGQGDTMVTVLWTGISNGTTLSVSAVNSCGESAPTSANMTVINAAEAEFGNDNESLTINFVNLSDHADTYKWYFGDGDSSDMENPAHKFPTRAVYTVQLIASNACSDSTFEKEISVDYGVGLPATIGQSPRLYPNPAKDELTLDFGNSKGTFELFDMDGRLVLRGEFDRATTIDVRSLTTGVYHYQIKSDQGNFPGKLEVRR